jgi:hypothetical protein
MKYVAVLAGLLVAGCTTVRTTSPTSSAEQQLLIATAADRAATALAAQIPLGLTAWIDRSGILVREQSYAIAAIEDALLRRGVKLVQDSGRADAIILPRAAMLSTDERGRLLGIPSVPVPLLPGAVLPALSLYSENEAKGSAKFAASVYDAHSGSLIVSTDPSYGFSRQDSGTVLFLFTWRKNDLGVDFDKTPPKIGSGPPR